MTSILNFKDIIDIPKWRIIAPVIPGGGFNGFQGFIYDMRNSEDRHPLLYWVRGDRELQAYNVKNDNWIDTGLALIATIQSFAGGFFMPGQGPRGTIAAGATTTSFTNNGCC
jgi:hypothetical protein